MVILPFFKVLRRNYRMPIGCVNGNKKDRGLAAEIQGPLLYIRDPSMLVNLRLYQAGRLCSQGAWFNIAQDSMLLVRGSVACG
jgi:hypothetical protein